MTRNPDTLCTNQEHQDGEHNSSCCPPADPRNPELRLLRAIFGLCGVCDNAQPHEHPDREYRSLTGQGNEERTGGAHHDHRH